MSDKRFEGEIGVFYPDKGWGFLSADGGGSGLFYHERDVRGDWPGSTAWAKVPGTPITFTKKTTNSRKYPGQTLVAADDVASVFPEEPATEDLANLREVSKVHKWNGKFGELIRECGSVLFFHATSVVQSDRLADLQIGDCVFHGISQREDGRWRASDIELYSREEQQRLQEGLPAYEVELETIKAESVVEPASELLTPANGKKTLLELIQEKRDA
jgi:cold shock CspA family protein